MDHTLMRLVKRAAALILPSKTLHLLRMLLKHWQKSWQQTKKLYREWQYKYYDGGTIQVNGMRFRLHQNELVSRHFFVNESFQASNVRALIHLSRPAETIIDIGANLGTTTVPLAMVIKKQIVSIEPVTVNFRLLSENIRMNNLEERVIPLQLAVGDKKGIQDIHLSTDNFGDHRLTVSSDEGRTDKETVELSTLDSIVEEYDLDEPFLIKIDVQGFETNVLRGSIQTLQKPCVLLMELWPWGLDVAGSSVTEIEAFCEMHHLDIFTVDTQLCLHPVNSLADITETLPNRWDAHTDIVVTNIPHQELTQS